MAFFQECLGPLVETQVFDVARFGLPGLGDSGSGHSKKTVCLSI